MVSCKALRSKRKYCKSARRDERVKLALSNEKALCHNISLSFASFKEHGRIVEICDLSSFAKPQVKWVSIYPAVPESLGCVDLSQNNPTGPAAASPPAHPIYIEYQHSPS